MFGRWGWCASAPLNVGTLFDRPRPDFNRSRLAGRITAAALFCLVAAGGCSAETRLPSLYPRPADTNPRSFSIHDPLPESDIGPDMAARQGQLGVPPGGGFSTVPGAPMVAPPGVPGTPATPGIPVAPGPQLAPGMPGGPGAPSSQAYPYTNPQ